MRPVTRVIIQERKEMILGWTPQTALPGVIVAAFIGATIGKKIVKKHLAA